MATGTYSPDPALTIFNADGDPVSGALLYTYAAGTTTPATTYSDVALTTPNSNPVVADSAGRLTVVLVPGQSYKYIAKTSAGVTLWTRDNILAVPNSAATLDVLGTAGETLAAGVPVYQSDGSGGNVAGRWYKTDGDLTYASLTPLVGMTTATIASGVVGAIRLAGEVTDLSGLSIGVSYYLSGTAGAITATAPGAARQIGVASSTTTLILIGPQPVDRNQIDLYVTAGEAITAGQAIYVSDGSGSKTAGRVYKADATTAYSSSAAAVVGIAPNAIASSDTGVLRYGGRVSTLSGLTTGTKYYVSSTPGSLSSTPGTFSRIVGIADSTTSLILLPPDATTTAPSTITTTGTQTALTIPASTGPVVVICNNATILTIQGITAGVDGQQLTLISKGAGQVDLVNQSGSATAANRLINGVTGTRSLAAGTGTAALLYDATEARWRVVAHAQGGWITRTFAAGNYTASAGTWTVASATRDASWLKDKTLLYSCSASGTTSGTPVSVRIAIPGGFTAAGDDFTAFYNQNPGTGTGEGGYVNVASGGTVFNFQRFNNVAFAAGTVTVAAQIQIEVQ
jgi:hypothetical protein